DLVARLGGDEFVILAGDLTRVEARNLAVRLSRIISAAIPLEDGTAIVPSASFGVAWAPQGAEGVTADDLLAAADREMYKRKRARRTNGTAVMGSAAAPRTSRR